MLPSRTITGLVLALASAAIVFAIGLPWLLKKYETPAEYAASQDASTEEVQEFDLMWANLETLQAKAAELGTQQFKQQFLGVTTDYLQLDRDQSGKFLKLVDESLARLDAARANLTRSRQQTSQQQTENDSAGKSQGTDWAGEDFSSIAARRDAWSQWRDEQQKSSDLLIGALQPSPRHNLLAERRLLWLLKLDFSLRDAEQSVNGEPVSGSPTR